MNADGSDPHFVINSLIYIAGATSWSPDGTRIAFDSVVPSCTLRVRIETVELDGSQRRVLAGDTGCPVEVTEAQRASWSPDSAQITYLGGNRAVGGVWVVNADGTNPVQLTHGGELPLAWLPHENRIAFIGAGGNSIWTMRPDGTDQVNVASLA